MLSRFRIFRKAQEGLAYLEFAISLPFLLMLFMGGVELTRYIIIVQKVEKSTMAVSDVVAQSSTINTTQLNTLVQAVEQIMLPYSFGTNGYVIISSVYRNGSNPPVVNWQYTGGGSWAKTSKVGTTNSTAILPSGFTMADKENVIVAEVYFNYSPMFATGVLPGGEVYKLAMYRPRLGDLTSLGN